MIINDILYGSCEINQPVLIELINTPEIQRLKEINMGGYYPGDTYAAGHPDYNRYTHSIGVMLLLNRFNAPIEEQIAGLIHDVSHSAFSHTIDYIIRETESQKEQSHQDNLHNEFVRHSSLATIISDYGFDLNYILDDSHFPLKENSLPDICADRIDYSLRAGFLSGDLSVLDKDYILNNLTICDGSFVMNTSEAATKFSVLFYNLNQNMWSGFSSAILFCVSALMFRRAIDISLLKLEDFYRLGDEAIIAIVEQFGLKDPKLAAYYHMLQQPPEYFCNDATDCLDRIFCKIRTVDPCFVTSDNRLQRISSVNTKYAAMIANQPSFKEYHVGIRQSLKD